MKRTVYSAGLVNNAIAQSLSELPDDRKGHIGFGDVMTLAMHVVELLQEDLPLAMREHGEEKKDLAKDMIWRVLDVAEEQGFMTKAQKLSLSNHFSVAVDVVDGLIDAFHFIKKHPAYIQFEQHVKKKCAGCIASRSH